MSQRGDLVILVSKTRLSYLGAGQGRIRARLYLVQAADVSGQIKTVRSSTSAPIQQLKDVEFSEMVSVGADQVDVRAALLSAPFEGFESSQEAVEYLEMFKINS